MRERAKTVPFQARAERSELLSRSDSEPCVGCLAVDNCYIRYPPRWVTLHSRNKYFVSVINFVIKLSVIWCLQPPIIER